MEKCHICISVGFLIELEIILYVEARIRNKSMYINHLRCYELSYFGTLCKFFLTCPFKFSAVINHSISALIHFILLNLPH